MKMIRHYMNYQSRLIDSSFYYIPIISYYTYSNVYSEQHSTMVVEDSQKNVQFRDNKSTRNFMIFENSIIILASVPPETC